MKIFLSFLILMMLCSCGAKEKEVPLSDDTAEAQTEPEEEIVPEQEEKPAFDIDISEVSQTVAYAQILDMASNPDNYKGKSVRMRGTFFYYYDQAKDIAYYTCAVQDATLCCAQGIEFELAEDKVYPDDYPAENAIFTVSGIFDTYQETTEAAGNVYTFEYCILRDAVIE